MKYITVALLVSLSAPVWAEDYQTESRYPQYGYGAAASTLPETGLKAGQRGAHVEDPKENTYYPGFTAGDPTRLGLLMRGPF